MNNNRRKEYKMGMPRYMLCGVLLMFTFIWINTFIRQNGFEGNWGRFTIVGQALIAAFMTIIVCIVCGFIEWFELFFDTYRDCMVGAAVSGTVFLAAILLEIGTDCFSLFGQEDIVLGIIEIPKRSAYDVWVILLFPLGIEAVFRTLKKDGFSPQAVFYSCVSVITLSLEGMLVFRPLPNIWSVDLLVMNSFTLGIAVWKYVLAERKLRAGNVLATIVLYIGGRLAFLPLLCNNLDKGFCTFICDIDWEYFREGIHELVNHAALFGTSEYLMKSEFIHTWLYNRKQPLLHLLYYGGWTAAIGMIILLINFGIIVVKLLDWKRARHHINWILYASAAAMLFIRVFFGILYSFGFPSPIFLPFFGKSEGVMDVAAFTVLIIGAVESYIIQKYEQIKASFVPVEELLGEHDAYPVFDEFGDAYDPEIFSDKFYICLDKKIWFTVEEISLQKRTFGVFTTDKVLAEEKRIILEYADGNWIEPKLMDEELFEKIEEEYKRENTPMCMERGGCDENEAAEDESI